MLCCLFLILCLSGCVSPEKSAEIQTELHIADGFYLNGFGDVVPFDADLYLYPEEQTVQLYDWAQFNEDHAPFTDLVSDDGTVFALRVPLPAFPRFSTMNGASFSSTAILQPFSLTIMSPVISLFIPRPMSAPR